MNRQLNAEPIVIEPPTTDVDFKKFMGTVLDTKLNEDVGKPAMYAVVLHNDNSTFPHFVVQVLVEAFKVPAQQAGDLMFRTHIGGQMVVCVLAKDVAETRLEAANVMTRAARPGKDFAASRAAACELTFSLEPEAEGE